MIYLFEDFALDAERRELWRGAKRIAIEPQVFDILLYLICQRDRVVSKDDLIANVWNGRIVAESTMSSRIASVRRAVGDVDAEKRLIRTLARKGLRFVGEVIETVSATRTPIELSQTGMKVRALPYPLASNTLARIEIPSIEVRPFANRLADPKQNCFVAGFAEEISAALSKFRWLTVIAGRARATNVERPKCAGRSREDPGARYLLKGSVRNAGRRLRIMAKLIDSKTDAYLWMKRFDGALDNMFDLQDQVVDGVVGAIAIRLEQTEIERAELSPSEEVDAYGYTLRGMGSLYRWTRHGINEALRNFHRAIEVNPEFAAAYGMAAYCYVQRKSNGWLSDREQDAIESAQLARRAAELARDDALTLAKAAHAISSIGGDIDSGAVFIDEAVQFNPHLAAAWYGSGWIRLFLGKPQEALEHLAGALRVSPSDPLTFKTHAAIAYGHFFVGNYDEASKWSEKALCARPNYLTAVRAAAASHAHAGRLNRARSLMAHMRCRDPSLRVSNLENLIPLCRTQDFDRWAEGLRKAGMPD